MLKHGMVYCRFVSECCCCGGGGGGVGGGTHHCPNESNVAVSMHLPDSLILWRSGRNSRKWVKLKLLI